MEDHPAVFSDVDSHRHMEPAQPSRSASLVAPARRLMWGRLALTARLGLGGVIIGSFTGVYLGAVLGLGYAAWVGNLSPALDGALLGGAVLALLGGCYGILLGVTERAGGDALPATDIELSPGTRPAGRRGATDTPVKEHTHG